MIRVLYFQLPITYSTILQMQLLGQLLLVATTATNPISTVTALVSSPSQHIFYKSNSAKRKYGIVAFANANHNALIDTQSSSIQQPTTSRRDEGTRRGIPSRINIKGVIFDMDGTLTKHCIDFHDLRKRIYDIADSDIELLNTPESMRRGDVLQLYQHFSEDGQMKAKAVFDDIETKAIRDMTLTEGVGDLCQYLDSFGIKRAVLTRNVLRSVNAMHGKIWEESGVTEFFPVVCRETLALDGVSTIKSKPSPDAIFHICNVWDCSPQDVIMIGDSDADDIVAASRAGCGGRILLTLDGHRTDTDCGGGGPNDDIERLEREPSLVIQSLRELMEILNAQ